MKLKIVFFAMLLALTGSAFAASGIPIDPTTSSPESAAYPHPPAGGHMMGCKKDEAKCEADAAKFDQWCSANAAKCTEIKAGVERHIEFCEKNAQKCEQMRAEMKAKHEQMCQQDPSKPHCHAIRANNQPGDQDQNGDQGADQTPPAPPVF